MTPKPTPGSRWRSAVCDTEAVVVRTPSTGGVPECGGVPMLPFSEPQPVRGEVSETQAGGTLLGKRYADTTTGLEMLCTKPGAGSLSIEGRRLEMREAKKLPSSD